MKRRTALQIGVAGLSSPLWAPAFREAHANSVQNRDVIVSVFLRGGQDGLNTLAPLGDPNYASLRPTIGLRAPGSATGTAALELDGYFGLHPGLAPLKPLYDQGVLAFVHATGNTSPSRSHFDQQDLMERGFAAQTPDSTGWLGRYLATNPTGNTSPFRGLGVGRAVQKTLNGGSALGLASIDSFGLQVDPTGQSLEAEQRRYAEYALRSHYTGTTLLDVTTVKAFAAVAQLKSASLVVSEPPVAYPSGPGNELTAFGAQLRDLATILKSGLGVEAACVDIGGWDHHANITASLEPLQEELAQGLAAFWADLGEFQMSTTVVVMTEFGRRARENASGGTDHGHGSVMIVLGGGVRGRKVYGTWPTLADSALDQGDLAITTDYRLVLSEILKKRANHPDVGLVFPGYTAGIELGLVGNRV